MKKLFAVVTIAAVVAGLVIAVTGLATGGDTPAVHASRLAGISSAGTTGIQVQNLDQSQDATIVADFYKQGGGGPIAIQLPLTPAGAAANIYLPTEDKLSNGAYAAIISADRQIAAIARTEWESSGGAALYSNVPPGNDVIVPLATKQYYGQTSLVSIQNTDPSAQATVEVQLFKTGESSPTKTVQLSIEPGTSITLDLGKSEHFMDIPQGFLGSMRVTSGTQIAVQSFIDFENSKMAVYAFEGVPAEQAAEKLYVPLFRRDYYGTTGISVVNPGDSPVDVTVNYQGTLEACAGQSYQETGTIAAGSSLVFYQGDAASPLPSNCAGAATVEATGGNIMAIVNDAVFGSGGTETSAAYNAVSDEMGATTVALPLFRRTHMPTRAMLTTGIQAMNIGTADANARISFKDSQGNAIPVGQEASVTIAPGGAHTWYPPNIQAIPDNTYGSASITSDQPLVVIVNDASFTRNAKFKMDSAIYNGIKADLQ